MQAYKTKEVYLEELKLFNSQKQIYIDYILQSLYKVI